jgi:hypothetical protein
MIFTNIKLKNSNFLIENKQYVNFFFAFEAIFAILDPIESRSSPGQDTIRYTLQCFFCVCDKLYLWPFFRVNPVLIIILGFLWDEILLENIPTSHLSSLLGSGFF